MLADDDLPQVLYERVRAAALDRRGRIAMPLLDALRAYGIAGLFLDPERVLACPSAVGTSRDASRKNTAMHHAHLTDQAFETIAKSLAEGVGC